MKIGPSVRAAWGRNLEVNRALVGHLTPEMLGARTSGGGFSVAQHLSHIVGVTKFWGAYSIRSGSRRYPTCTTLMAIHSRMAPKWTRSAFWTCSRPPRRSRWPQLKLAHRGLMRCRTRMRTYLVHMIVHDAHHRGQILLALKASSFPLPDEGALWASWRS